MKNGGRRIYRAAVLSTALFLPAFAACSGADPSAEQAGEVGTARLAIASVPADVSCVKVTAKAGVLKTYKLDTVPGQSAVFDLEGLPAGTVTFNGLAFDVSCGALTSTTAPTWQSDPVTVSIAGGAITQLTLTMRQNGAAEVTVDFGGGTSCSTGTADCNANAADGCEVNLMSDVLNCGACGSVCINQNGTPTCVAGSCIVGCAPGFADCNANPSDGCEVNLNADATNCGSCGSVCSGSNGVPTCSAGSCQLSCNPGFADCDANPANGCEVNLNTSTGNCGSCNFQCLPLTVCQNGQCTF